MDKIMFSYMLDISRVSAQTIFSMNIGKDLESELMQTSDMLMLNYLYILLAVTLFVFVVHQFRKAFRKKK